VLDRAIAAQLKGKSRHEWRTEGLAYELAVKVS
jgi:hypothetical protein